MNVLLSVLGSAALALGACGGRDAQEVVDKEIPALKQRFGEYQTAVRAALAKPVAEPPKLPEKLFFPPLYTDGDKANALLILPEWIEMPVKHDPDGLLSETLDIFIDVRDVAHGSPALGKASIYDSRIAAFKNAKYLVLVTGHARGGIVAGSTYSGGGYHGSLIFVDVAKSASIGTIEVSASTADSVKVAVDSSHSVQRQLDYDAKQQAIEAINKALAPHLAPGSRVPAS
ncbi:MAG: hypothetical protein H0T46_04200 [Deltaproteobacteria bacterium]|nr:hypothetical protein [Deltaproteobacteria bacterium]